MTFLYILIVLSCIVLVALVLMQDSKSGLGGITGGATMNTFGANTDKALIKATSVTAGIFFILVIFALVAAKSNEQIDLAVPETSVTKKAQISEEKTNEVNVNLADATATPAETKPEAAPSAEEKPVEELKPVPTTDEAPKPETSEEPKPAE